MAKRQAVAQPKTDIEDDNETKSGKRQPSTIFLDKADGKKEGDGPVVQFRSKKSRKIVFGWYGGKFSHLGWLLPLLPKCHHYCEPFSGSGAVLLNREPSSVETYNDIDGDVVNFFRVLRDRGDELIRACALTPFSREEYYKAIHGSQVGISDVERARRFFIRARQTRTGLAQTASLGRWANCKDTSRSGMSGVVSRWLGGIEGLDDVAERIVRVQIENRPATDLIRLYDSPGTLFYCDPLYVHSTRGDTKAYGFEMDDQQHKVFADTLNGIKGKAAVSGYRCDLMDELFKGWQRFDAPMKKVHSTKDERQESLWTNYDLEPLLKAAKVSPPCGDAPAGFPSKR